MVGGDSNVTLLGYFLISVSDGRAEPGASWQGGPLQVFDVWQQQGLQPDVITHSAIICARGKAGWQRGSCKSQGEAAV